MALVPGPQQPGEYKSAQLLAASAMSLSTNTAKTVTGVTLSLQPGIWRIWGVIDFQFAVNTSYTILQAGIGTTTDTLPTDQDTVTILASAANVPTNAIDIALPVVEQILTVRTATTYQLVAKATFTVSTLKAYGTLFAVRIR